MSPELKAELERLGIITKPDHAPVAWPKPKPTSPRSNPVANPGEF